MRVIVIGQITPFGIGLLLSGGCASGPATVNVNVPPTSTVSSIVIVNTSNVTKPVELQANGNDLSYAAAGTALGAGVGSIAGNPAAGALIGAGGGVAVYQLKEALTPATPTQTGLQKDGGAGEGKSFPQKLVPAPASVPQGGDVQAGISIPGG